jgi:uncharacterized membrane protein
MIVGKTSLGIDDNLAGMLCYALGWVTGIVFLVVEKESKYVRFHAVQAIATFLPLMIVAWVLAFIPFIGMVVSALLWILAVVLWLILMIKAYQGERYKLPIVGDLAEKQAE